MPVLVGEMTSEVTVLDGDLPLAEPQLEKLVKLVIQRIQEQERERKYNREATTLRRYAAPATPIRE
jgi:hypothetical protein